MTALSFFRVETTRVRHEQLSDHEPVIQQDVISWNIMMQGKYNREKNRYNNGFELIETQGQYQYRLHQIARVLAEKCEANPQVQIICLQEAPIIKEDIQHFIESCLCFPSLKKFEKSLRDENALTSWGLMSLFDGTHYDYILNPYSENGLESRVQKFKLTPYYSGSERTMINLHLPFDFAKKDPELLAGMVKKMVPDISNESKIEAMIAGDFNFPVTRFSELHKLGHVYSPKNNSTENHGERGGYNTLESVDAIIKVKPKNC